MNLSSWVSRLAAGVSLGFVLASSAIATDAFGAQKYRLSATVKRKLSAIFAEKASCTEAERKIGSRLRWTMKQGGKGSSSQVSRMRQAGRRENKRPLRVIIKAEVTDGLLQEMEGMNCQILNRFPQYGTVEAYVPFEAILELASRSDVRAIRRPDQFKTNKIDTSEGDVAHRVNMARDSFSVDGTGVTACAISDGVDFLAQLTASGDLPFVEILPWQDGSGSEGTRGLEILHDLAPGATLKFATAGTTQEQMAINILSLAGAGCDVIVDDVFFFNEPFFQDGVIARAIEDVVQGGTAYFSAAGDGGNFNDSTSSVWEGDFFDSGVGFDNSTTGQLHDFGGEAVNPVLASSPFPTVLHWADPLGGSNNDYDLCLLNDNDDEVFCSIDFQDGTQDPIEVIPVPLTAGDQLLIVNFAGLAEPRFLHLDTFGAALTYSTNGAIGGHPGAGEAITVAAVDVAQAGGGAFNGSEQVESFSSDGPRRVFFDADGIPFTPGDATSTGGILRQKPDLAAADGVSVATPGPGSFVGTSAAAAHAAAVAALLKQADPTLTPAQMRSALTSTARDIEAPGVDENAGFGLIDAFDAVDLFANAPEIINDLLILNGLNSMFDPTDSRAPAGVFTIEATFSNISSSSFFDVFFEVSTLTGGNSVLNAIGGPSGEGSQVSGPSQLDPGESFDIVFEIGLQAASPFRFFIDAFGTPD